ncbi:TcfC E-set like domain-containing protein [Microbulbifer sp. CAU 1566]|uniref:TcfC E-set like domain-containing protein n=1 Tax=Microbulbifer sp. CAU 1566 TaxID=2933269 RepID=UPI0020042EA8|nr:TcfC E-set like domain-containing protein [Microbulbifer sp. CAU 1566]MCK7598420.1 TcfC E-set like domain-containing protein [Microbulbifer sp. CAU 1566]
MALTHSKRKITLTWLTLFGFTLSGPLSAATAAFVLESGVPEGFAELTEPRQLVADLYFGGKPIGAAEVIVTPDSVQFSDPLSVLQLLPNTLAPEAILAELANPQPPNAHKICRTRKQQDCGAISTDSLAVIYDDSKYRVDLFLAPAWLPQQNEVEDPYLPESSSDLSLVQQLSGSWSGVRSENFRDSRSYNLAGKTILGIGEGALWSQWSTTDTGNEQIHQLQWSRDYRGQAYAIGLMQPVGSFSNFVSTPYLYGLEYRSSIRTRTDTSHQQGSPLEVNLPVRGRVEVHRDNRLLHSVLLEAGNHLLDTSILPPGSYEIEVRTFDDTGRPLNTFTTLFSKDALLPPPGEWRWTLQAGQPAYSDLMHALPKRIDDHFAQANIARRVADDIGIFSTLATTEDVQLMEAGARWVTPHLELSPSLVKTTDGREGHRIQGLFHSELFTLSISDLKLNEAQVDPLVNQYSLLPTGQRQRNASLNTRALGGQLSMRYSKHDRPQSFAISEIDNENNFNPAKRLATLEFSKLILRTRSWFGRLNLSYGEADGEAYGSIGVQFRMRDGRWQHTATLNSSRELSGTARNRGGYSTQWNDGDLWAADVEQELTIEASSSDQYLESRSTVTDRRGSFTSSLRYLDDEFNSALNYVGSFNTSIMSTGDTHAWGGGRSFDSAVILDINGSPGDKFEVLVDGTPQGYAKGGDRTVIDLAPFRTYDLSLRPLGDGFFEYEDDQEALTLYPGGVAHTNYDIKSLVIVMGRLLRAGKPVKNTRISIGTFSAKTDDLGIFQLEMYTTPRNMRAPYLLWGNCKIALTEQTSGEDWLNLGVIELGSSHCEKSQPQLVGIKDV